MKLGRLTRAIRTGMNDAKRKEVIRWIESSEKQTNESYKKIYLQIANAIDDSIERVIDSGLEVLLDEYSLSDQVFKINESKETRNIDLEEKNKKQVIEIDNEDPFVIEIDKPRRKRKSKNEQS